MTTPLLPISATGEVEIPTGTLHFGIRYTWGETTNLLHASNTEAARLFVDVESGSVEVTDLMATDTSGERYASLTLRGDLINTQPRPMIGVSPGSGQNSIILAAETTDAEFDPIEHQWMILGVGRWSGDSIEVVLPAGRHGVVLYADDVHGARGIAATWIELPTGALP